MNMRSTWDDTQIHAYVDGELDAQLSAQLEADSRADSMLAARIARQRQLRRLLHAQFDPVLEEPVPAQLREAIAGDLPKAEVIPIQLARRTREPGLRPAWSAREWGAIAATLLLGTLLGAVAFRSADQLPMESVQGRLVARATLDAALSTQLAGSMPATASTRVGLSFRAADGAFCRTFSLRNGAAGLACRHDRHWVVQVLDDSGAGQPAAADGFRQASSPLSPALVGAISTLGAGDALTAEQEQQQVRGGWDALSP